MNDIDWNQIHLPGDCYAECLVATFKVNNYRAIKDLSIEIWGTNNPNQHYLGVSSYEFWGPHQAHPYISLHGGDSIEMAFNDAMMTFSFDKDEFPNEVVFFVKDGEDEEPLYFDGNGERVNLEEAYKRRAEYLEDNPPPFAK